jgi:hypothetical protein
LYWRIHTVENSSLFLTLMTAISEILFLNFFVKIGLFNYDCQKRT